MSSSATTNLIATVESYLCPSLPVRSSASKDLSLPALHLLPLPTLQKLRNAGPTRAKDLRALGQSKQILSHVPIMASPQTCAKFNDTLYSTTQLNTDKLSAFALLPTGTGQGNEAAKELQRCISKYKFVGGMLGLRRNKASAFDESFDLLWSSAEKYRVPIALREQWPTASDVDRFFSIGS